MMSFFRRLRAWYLRRLKALVAIPGGTSWQQHSFGKLHGLSAREIVGIPFVCTQCTRTLNFGNEHYHVVESDPETGAAIHARYVLICACGRGHWMDASPKGAAK